MRPPPSRRSPEGARLSRGLHPPSPPTLRQDGDSVMMRQFELVELVKSYDPNADEAALNRAYVYSMKAHGAQLRASGDPYFSHPIEVAGLLAGMRLETAPIVT